jgi:hypothetical protein
MGKQQNIVTKSKTSRTFSPTKRNDRGVNVKENLPHLKKLRRLGERALRGCEREVGVMRKRRQRYKRGGTEKIRVY